MKTSLESSSLKFEVSCHLLWCERASASTSRRVYNFFYLIDAGYGYICCIIQTYATLLLLLGDWAQITQYSAKCASNVNFPRDYIRIYILTPGFRHVCTHIYKPSSFICKRRQGGCCVSYTVCIIPIDFQPSQISIIDRETHTARSVANIRIMLL